MKLTTAPLLLVFALLAVLAGCGGGSGSTSTTATPSTATATTQKSQGHKERKSSKQSGGAQQKPAAASAPTDPNPLPNQGTKAVAPGVPTVKHGDNSIQTYGVEADAAERIAATRDVKAFLDAEAAKRWDTACTYLSSSLRDRFAQLVKKQPRAVGRGCGAGMAVLFAKAPEAYLRAAAKIHVLSFRSKGPQAFVVYRSGAGKYYNLPLVREGGEWKLTASAGVALVL